MSRHMNDEELHQPLTRADFDTAEQWHRYRHEGGLEPFERGPAGDGVRGASGHYGELTRAIYGATRREFQRVWQGWGESRNVSFEKVQWVFRAIAFANCLGRVLSTRFDVTWSTVGVTSDRDVADAQRELLDWLRRWLDRHADWAAFVWVLERGPEKGLHSHILLHCPDGMGEKLRQDAEAALTRIAGRPLVNEPSRKTFKIQPRGADIVSQWKRFRYMMKGIDPDGGWSDGDEPSGFFRHTERLHIDAAPQGDISVKRVGVSRALDKASFERWSSLNDFPDMTIERFGAWLYDSRYWSWYCENWDRLKEPPETRNGNAKPTNGNDGSEETDWAWLNR